MVIEPDTLAERVYGDNDIRVNSNHHMAIDDVADGFLATGRCPDGVIEMIESLDDDWLAIGTQFHPESPSATALDIGVFREFVRGVVAQKQKEGIQLLEVEDPVLA
jgi:putative glutamine amidotransferase